MTIINVKNFTYPIEERSKWHNVIFQPIEDYKFSIRLNDGGIIECAAFRLVEKGNEEMHACISTQAGCKFNCQFCASGRNGFLRNLTAEEILNQIDIMTESLQILRFDHVVFMGIGEPMDNLKNVCAAVKERVGTNPYYDRRFSLASVGLIGKFDELLGASLPLRMFWLSLHSAIDEKRRMIMPVAKAYRAKDLISKALEFAIKSGAETWINYMILHGFNDLDDDVSALVHLLRNTERYLSVMITIPNGNIGSFLPGTADDADSFEKRLASAGIKNRINRFFAAGRSVNAGCGEFIFLP